MQLPASPELSGIIRHYLSLDGEETVLRRLRLFSDGSTSIVFNASSALTLDDQPLPDAFIYGQITGYRDLECRGRVRLFVIVFQPDGFNRVFGMPAGELKDQVIALSDLPEATDLQQIIRNREGLQEKIAATETFFLRLLAGCSWASDPTVTAALQLIQQHHGMIAVHELAHTLSCHPRYLERQFNTAIGLSPKRYCNVTRTHAFLRQLQLRSNLTSKAYETGFFDQAHLIREFRQLTGLTPSQYQKKAVPLAVNLLWLPDPIRLPQE